MTHGSPSGCCPDCGRPLTADPPPGHCPHCALPLTGPVFARVRQIEADLWRLDEQRARLFADRRGLLNQLRASGGPRPAPVGPTGAGGPAAPPRFVRQDAFPGAPAGPGPRSEASPRTARNVLLILGGVLLTVAALAFTLLSWGRMGIGGRAAVLATLTVTAAAVPALLLRRALRATAEAVAAVGLVLLLLDAYALWQVSLSHTDPVRYTAVAAAVVAALWTAYALLLPRPGLRIPLPAAVVLAQLPVPLCAAAAGAGTHGSAWALLATASADVLLVVSAGPLRPALAVRVTAAVTALLTGGPALLLAGSLSVVAEGPAGALRAGALLSAAAAVLLLAGRRERTYALPLGGAAGLLLVAASGGVVRTVVPSGVWTVPGYLLCAVGLMAAVAARIAVGARSAPPAGEAGAAGALQKSGAGAAVRAAKTSSSAGMLLAAVLVQACVLLSEVPALVQALVAPLGWAVSPWQGAPAGAVTDPPGVGPGWFGDAATPVVFAVPAVVCAVAGRFPVPGDAAVRAGVRSGALVLAWAAAITTPSLLRLPYPAVTCWLTVLGVALLAWPFAVPGVPRGTGDGPAPARRTEARGAASLAATALALVTAGSATGWALADRTATLAVLGVLGTAFAAASWLSVRAGAEVPAAAADASSGDASSGDASSGDAASGEGAPAARGALCAAAAVLCGAGLARAIPAALGVPPERAAFAVLAAAAAAALLAARLRTAPSHAASAAVSPAVECTGYAVAGWALVLSASSAALLSLMLGLCGVLVAGVALRADRRPAGAVASVLFLLATWVRLYASEVRVPEAYTLPLAVAALAVGVLRARRTPGLSSWAAYGPALSCALLPGLVMVWGDPQWLRPLLLGTGALAVTLLGARLRLQAPLLLGGGTLALVALHELAPYLTQVIGLLPRWLPPALAGLLLLAVGATYEQRLRDARRLRTAWRRLG